MALAMTDVAERAKRQLAEVTGFQPVAAVASYRDAKGWHVSVDMLEMARLPDSTDLLGTYVVELDQEGSMVRFEKKRSRLRGQPYEEAEE